MRILNSFNAKTKRSSFERVGVVGENKQRIYPSKEQLQFHIALVEEEDTGKSHRLSVTAE